MHFLQEIGQEPLDSEVECIGKVYWNEMINGAQGAISWTDLKLSAVVLPVLEKQTKELIQQRLGYLPPESITSPFEFHLRTFIQDFNWGKISKRDLYSKIDPYIKLIRNEDIKPNDCLEYDPSLFKLYEQTFIPYGQMAKDRIMRFLDYEPKLEHSLFAEIWLRSILEKDFLQLPDKITQYDNKALTIIKYREFLLFRSKNYADGSPLFCAI